MSSYSRWSEATMYTKNAASLSRGFRTLRDMAQDVFIDAAALSKKEKLGEGSYASVDLAVLDGVPVAVKTLKPSFLESEHDLQDFLHEAALLRKLKHPGIVRFVGVAICINPAAAKAEDSSSKSSPTRMASAHISKLMRLKQAQPPTIDQTQPVELELTASEADKEDDVERINVVMDKVMLVQEFMSRGTLKSIVAEQMACPMKNVYSRAEGMQWLIQIAKALKYLHSARPQIIHRDLKLENIMLTLDVNGKRLAKIGDFGLHAVLKKPKEMQESERTLETTGSLTLRDSFLQDDLTSSVKASYSLSGRTGSMMYMAPEVLQYFPYNEKADVFSFAIIMYEVLNKMLMLAFVSCRGLPEEVQNYAYGVAAGNRPKIPDGMPESFSRLIRRCWAQNAYDRPTMHEIVAELTDLQDHEWATMEKFSHRCTCCAMQ